MITIKEYSKLLETSIPTPYAIDSDHMGAIHGVRLESISGLLKKHEISLTPKEIMDRLSENGCESVRSLQDDSICYPREMLSEVFEKSPEWYRPHKREVTLEEIAEQLNRLTEIISEIWVPVVQKQLLNKIAERVVK